MFLSTAFILSPWRRTGFRFHRMQPFIIWLRSTGPDTQLMWISMESMAPGQFTPVEALAPKLSHTHLCVSYKCISTTRTPYLCSRTNLSPTESKKFWGQELLLCSRIHLQYNSQWETYSGSVQSRCRQQTLFCSNAWGGFRLVIPININEC